MSHPKSNTQNQPAQDLSTALELCTVHRTTFWGPSGREMFELRAQTQAGDALKESSSLLAGALSIAEEFGDHPEAADGNVMFVLRFAIEGAKALLDGGTYGIEMGLSQGGAQ